MTIALVAGFLLLLLAAYSSAAGQAEDWDIPNGHFYTQTGIRGSTGFSVTDDGGVLFWREFQRLGGVAEVGYPMSRRFIWDGFVTQVMQKAVFQWRPEHEQVYFINVFDEMHDAGKDDWLLVVRSTPKPLPPGFDAGKSWEQIVRDRLALLDANPAIKARYFAVDNPMVRYGLPTSPVVDSGNHYAIRLQRAVMQQWKVDVPWAKKGQVTVANGGDVAVEAGMFPREITTPQYPPGVVAPPTPTPTPIICSYLPVRGFGKVWQENALVREYVGCPVTKTERAALFRVQRFERGAMLWIESLYPWETSYVYALFADNMTYARIVDTWQPWQTEPPPLSPSPGLYEPRERLGKAWREGAGVRERLGWAVEAEKVGGPWDANPAKNLAGSFQQFQWGSMVWIPYKAGTPQYLEDRWIYVLSAYAPRYVMPGPRNDWLAYRDLYLPP